MLEFNSADKKIYEIDDETGKNIGFFCEGFIVKKTISDFCSGAETAVIEIFAKAGKNQIEVPLAEFTPQQLPKHLLSHGVTFLSIPDISSKVTAYALDSKNTAPISYSYDRLGWYQKKKKRYFLGAYLMNAQKRYDSCKHQNFNKLAPKGTFEAWRNGIIPFLDHPETALALAIGVSATIIPILKEANIFNSTAIFALIGQSSTYKTTMLKLMASIYGKPEIGAGVIDTMLDTTNFFYNQLGYKTGFIHLIDDISAADGHDFTNEIYNISMGKNRGRLTPDGKPRKIDTWATSVVYTGESSILAQTNNNLGLYARVVEFNFTWLKSKENINDFYDTINDNYGVALEPLIRKLFSISTEKMRDYYQKAYKKIINKIKPTNNVGERIVQVFSILIISAFICNKAWDLKIETKAIQLLLEETYKKNSLIEDPMSDIINALKSEIIANESMFITNGQKLFNQNTWGIHGAYKELPCIWISADKMLEIAKKAKITNFKEIQKDLADRGVIVRNKSNHYKFPKKIHNIEVDCYGFYTSAKNKKPEPPKKRKGQKGKSGSQIKYLLSDFESEEMANETQN